MSYCTIEDIKANIPDINIIQLTDDEGVQVINDVYVNEAIAYADSLIDGYLRGRYIVPLMVVPRLINKISIDLAIFHLYSRRFELEMAEAMVNRYKNAVKILEQIREGVIQLALDTGMPARVRFYEV